MDELKFRNLGPKEVVVQKRVTGDGVTLLLYPIAVAVEALLDEKVGPFNWQRSHSNGNKNCTVAIWAEDKKEWVKKEGVGATFSIRGEDAEKEKRLASDSFVSACKNFGIGRELHSAPKMFVPKERLRNYKEQERECFDSFSVSNIEYSGDKIVSVTVKICQSGKPYDEIRFVADAPADTNTSAAEEFFAPGEVILFGNCKGKKYGDVKDTETFKSFMKWVKGSHTSYPDKKVQDQYLRFKAMGGASA